MENKPFFYLIKSTKSLKILPQRISKFDVSILLHKCDKSFIEGQFRSVYRRVDFIILSFHIEDPLCLLTLFDLTTFLFLLV